MMLGRLFYDLSHFSKYMDCIFLITAVLPEALLNHLRKKAPTPHLTWKAKIYYFGVFWSTESPKLERQCSHSSSRKKAQPNYFRHSVCFQINWFVHIWNCVHLGVWDNMYLQNLNMNSSIFLWDTSVNLKSLREEDVPWQHKIQNFPYFSVLARKCLSTRGCRNFSTSSQWAFLRYLPLLSQHSLFFMALMTSFLSSSGFINWRSILWPVAGMGNIRQHTEQLNLNKSALPGPKACPNPINLWLVSS